MNCPDNFHIAPKGYRYEVTSHSRSILAIWIVHCREFDYNNGEPVRCIWGFYNTKTSQYHSPIHSSKIGNVVGLKQTTPYSAMQIKQTPLEAAYV